MDEFINKQMKKRPSHSLYRKLYEDHHGKIPTDEFGRSFDIHHIDGNPFNNSLENLIALSVLEHFDLHKKQGDYAAAAILAKRLRLSPEEISRLSRETQMAKIKNGTHHLLKKGIEHPKYDKTIYTWENIQTLEKLNLTQSDFCFINNFSPQPVNNLVRGERKSYKNWRIYSDELYVNNNYDQTIYKWVNIKTNEILVMTQKDFKDHNLIPRTCGHVSSLIRGKIKTYKNWIVEKND